MNAIQTKYAGCLFRSRLEARWAIFLDRMRYKWVYEPEGFVLPSGPYLPDFELPEFGMYLEIKGFCATEIEKKRCYELSQIEKPVLLSEGNIGEETMTLYAIDACDSGGGDYEVNAHWCDPCYVIQDTDTFTSFDSHPRTPTLAVSDSRVERDRSVLDANWKSIPCKFVDVVKYHLTSLCVQPAYEAARSARFEHGESPGQKSRKW